MWQITLSTHEMSKVVWRRLFSQYSFEIPSAVSRLMGVYERLERDRTVMAYNTGTISFSSAIALYVITRRVNPTAVFEVGTFIGRSAAAILAAMDMGGNPKATFQTCDFSNDFVMDTSGFRTPVMSMPRTDSTTALKLAVAQGLKFDMFHFDGRLQLEDLDLVAKVSTPYTAVLLDDFEGIEKGVANAALLSKVPAFAKYFLIEPPSAEVLAPFGINDRCLTAMLMPQSAFLLTPQ